ncbi:hypothetical protein E4U17_007172 [Claviceps sp. LM77 group G4]|nr:hypothetical protein E4U17_007172 [Claviceps sp. LM77 group G4]KAG6066240.1 hypothetical protein E4U33_005634 [Claviceps sp. LM78 group G4]KAG6070922.1 hypothetical protein E4U16_006504 [Claviceps sp. LM84 group G4]
MNRPGARAEREGGRVPWGGYLADGKAGGERRKAVCGNKRAEAEEGSYVPAKHESGATKPDKTLCTGAGAQHATSPGKRGSTTLAATVTGVLVAQGDPH